MSWKAADLSLLSNDSSPLRPSYTDGLKMGLANAVCPWYVPCFPLNSLRLGNSVSPSVDPKPLLWYPSSTKT